MTAFKDLKAKIQREFAGLTNEQIEEKARLFRQHCDQADWSEEQGREFSIYVWRAIEESGITDKMRDGIPESQQERRARRTWVNHRFVAWLKGFGVAGPKLIADMAFVMGEGEERAIKRGQGDPERLPELWASAAQWGPSSLEQKVRGATKKPN